VGSEIFRTCPDRPWGLPNLLYNGCRVFPGGKERPGRDADPSPPTSAVGHERVEVYIFLPLGLRGLSLTPRHYNPCRVLADSRSRLQPSLSLALLFQFLTPSLSASHITSSIHLRFGLPTRLLPSGLSKVIFLHGKLSCILTICPAHLNLVILTVVTRIE